jgi:hypothetical protein
MNRNYPILDGAKIISFVIKTDDDCKLIPVEYTSYEIHIKTDKGTFIVHGCHDSSPEVDILDE